VIGLAESILGFLFKGTHEMKILCVARAGLCSSDNTSLMSIHASPRQEARAMAAAERGRERNSNDA